jgi:hypothetical protein
MKALPTTDDLQALARRLVWFEFSPDFPTRRG